MNSYFFTQAAWGAILICKMFHGDLKSFFMFYEFYAHVVTYIANLF